MTAPQTEIPTLAKIAAVARDIKLSHSVFALPFAVLATFLATAWSASDGRLPSAVQLILIIGCMVMARTAAMTMNRWADAATDARNPRTLQRALPSGQIRPALMLAVAIGSSLTFIALCSGFWIMDQNPWPILLSPLMLAYLIAYSFTKRFTCLCHFVLGSALALSPMAAVMAIDPPYLIQAPPYLLALMVLCWVAGFDIIYALQDTEVDRAQGLFSVPARFGQLVALRTSRVLHLIAGTALIATWWYSPHLGTFFLIASIGTISLLILEHALVWADRTARSIQTAFFTVNGIISLLLGTAGIADVLYLAR